MSGGSFLVSLREVINSERILQCRSLLKENISFWEEDLQPEKDENIEVRFHKTFRLKAEDIANSVLDSHSTEVAITLAGYVAKKLVCRTKCNGCKVALSAQKVDLENNAYLSLLSRGKLFVPSKKLADFVCNSFAALDYAKKNILSLKIPARIAATLLLENYGPACYFTCSEHYFWGFKFASKIIIDIYFNNIQKLVKDNDKKNVLKVFKARQRRKQ